MPSESLVNRLYDRPEYAAVARMVRYETLAYDDVKPYVAELEQRFGAAKVRQALMDVCVTDWGVTPVTIRLRPQVRKHCFQLLGPAPEQEDWFYTHPDGSPRERPPRKPPDALAARTAAPAPPPTPAAKKPPRGGARRTRATPPAAAEPAKAVEATAVVQPAPEPAPPLRVYTEADEDSPLAQLTDEGLVESHREAKECCGRYSRYSRIGQKVRQELAELEVEFRRRGLEVPA